MAPAGPSATAEDVTPPVSPASAWPAPISTITQPTEFSGRRKTRSAPTEANVTPRNAKPTSARSPNPNASGIIGTGSTIRSVIAPIAPISAATSPPIAYGRAKPPHQRSQRPMREGAIASPTVPCRSSRTARQVGLIAQPLGEGAGRALPVVAGAIEAPIDDRLGAAPERTEQTPRPTGSTRRRRWSAPRRTNQGRGPTTAQLPRTPPPARPVITA